MKPRRTNVRGIIFKDGKLLVTKYRQDDGSESKHWGTFGGGLELGESIITGLRREMIEETGIVPEIGNLLFIQQYEDDEKEYFELFFHIKNTNDYSEVKLEETTHGLQELTRHGFMDPKTEYVLPSFLGEVDIAAHISTDAPVRFYSELV